MEPDNCGNNEVSNTLTVLYRCLLLKIRFNLSMDVFHNKRNCFDHLMVSHLFSF